MSGQSSRWSSRLGVGLVVLGLALAPACFQGVDATKIVCGDNDHCPSGFRCEVDPTTQQGRCRSKALADGSTTSTTDAPPGDYPVSMDVPSSTTSGGADGSDAGPGAGGALAAGGVSGASGAGGSSGTLIRDAGPGTGGIVVVGGMTGLGGAVGLGGVVGLGGTAGATTGGQSGAIGSGGQGATGGSGGTTCPTAGQIVCITGCIDPKTDDSHCGDCIHTCDQGQRCMDGVCGCDKTSCPGGCCSDGGRCIEPSGQSGVYCGKPGESCVACPFGGDCISGYCACGGNLTLCPGADSCVDLRTDQNHCASCSKACADGCAASQCFTRVVSLTSSLTDFAVDATHIYFTSQNDGTVSRVSRSGGQVQVLASAQPYPQRIAVDGSNVYWLNMGTGNGGTNLDGSVMKVPLAGGNPVALATMEPYPQGIATDGANVYWTNTLGPGLAAGAVMKVPVAGGSKVVLASDPSYWSPRGIAVDASFVYWINMGEAATAVRGSIMKVPVAGGAAVTLASNVQFPVEIALRGSTIYFTCWEDAAGVEKLSKSGGTPVMVWPKPVDQSARIAVDDTSLYLAQGSTGKSALLKIDLASDVSTPITPLAFNIVLDDKNFFWSDSKGINVMPKLP